MKKTLIVLAVLVALAVPISAFAVTSDSPLASNIRSFCGIRVDGSNLTEQQKQDLEESFNKMIDLRKETINKMVQNGTITKEQGDYELSRIEDMIKYRDEYGYGPGMMGPGMMNGYGNGRGMMNGYGQSRGMMGRGYNNWNGAR